MSSNIFIFLFDLHFSSPCVPTSGSELRKDLVAAEGLHQDMPEGLDPNVKDLACHVMACLCMQALNVLLTYSSFLQQLFFYYSDCILAAAKDTFSKARKAMTKTLKKWLRSIVLFFNM